MYGIISILTIIMILLLLILILTLGAPCIDGAIRVSDQEAGSAYSRKEPFRFDSLRFRTFSDIHRFDSVLDMAENKKPGKQALAVAEQTRNIQAGLGHGQKQQARKAGPGHGRKTQNTHQTNRPWTWQTNKPEK